MCAISKHAKSPGSIVNIITRSSHGGQPFLTAYSTSKGALATLTKNNAHALRTHRIRVNGLNIGWADTPGEHAIQRRDGNPVDWLAHAEPQQPFGRLIKPHDVAMAAVYLLSDASEMMTGALSTSTRTSWAPTIEKSRRFVSSALPLERPFTSTTQFSC